jgi:hypothetical protein
MEKTFGKKREPPCEQCWPGIHDHNVYAWEVYQAASLSSMGLSVTDVLSVCDLFEITEKDEVLYKVRLLLSYLSELEGKEEDGK